jgi:hypothetical protein
MRMDRIAGWLLGLLVAGQVQAHACTHQGRTQEDIDRFVAQAQPGQTLCLAPGRYHHVATPPSFAGTASQPITIRAAEDGTVLIDSGTSRPLDLQGSYGILEGVNAQGGDNTTLAMRGTNWIARRVMLWSNNEPSDPHSYIVSMAGSHNTLEDCGAFGNARAILTAGAGQSGDTYNVVRRCWTRFEKRHATNSPDVGIVVGYAGQSRVTIENVVATWDRRGGDRGHEADPPIHISNTRDSLIAGSISYAPAGANFEPGSLFESFTGEADRGWTLRNRLRDFVVVAHPSQSGKAAFGLDAPGDGGNVVESALGISSTPGSCRTSGWAGCDRIRHFGSVEAARAGLGRSIWEAYPGICKRVVDGKVTEAPLWPWPMQTRLQAALRQSGREPLDLTATMEGLLGPIPTACRGSGPVSGGGVPPRPRLTAPRNLRGGGR